jgi:hypothetical protein
MSVKISQPIPNVLYLEFSSHKDMLLTMFRIQEFYESPHKNIKNKYFTIEEFLDTHMEENGDLDYYSKWAGFNLPCYIINDFFKTFKDLTPRETKLAKMIYDNIQRNNLFYVVAGCSGDSSTANHEIAHSLFYMDTNYKVKSLELIKKLSPAVRRRFNKMMLETGYAKEVLDDETQAYLGTSLKDDLHYLFGSFISKNTLRVIKELSDLFQITLMLKTKKIRKSQLNLLKNKIVA